MKKLSGILLAILTFTLVLSACALAEGAPSMISFSVKTLKATAGTELSIAIVSKPEGATLDAKDFSGVVKNAALCKVSFIGDAQEGVNMEIEPIKAGATKIVVTHTPRGRRRRLR